MLLCLRETFDILQNIRFASDQIWRTKSIRLLLSALVLASYARARVVQVVLRTVPLACREDDWIPRLSMLRHSDRCP